MFLRILAGFVALLALLWVVAYASSAAALRREEAEPWPFGLGSMNDAAARRKASAASPEAKRISDLIEALDVEDESAAGAYVAAQVAKHDDAIAAPAKETGLAAREAPLAALVRASLSDGDRVIWDHRLYGQFDLDDSAELLATAALDRARSGDGAAAWDELHAMWILTRSLDRGSVISDVTTLRLEREANAVARMLPAPAPPWTAELATIEPRRETAAFIQEEARPAINFRATRGPLMVLEWLFKPLRIRFDASQARVARLAAATMATSPPCRIDVKALDAAADDDHAPAVYRAARIEAELEATAKILALKNERARLGRWPAALPDGGARDLDPGVGAEPAVVRVFEGAGAGARPARERPRPQAAAAGAGVARGDDRPRSAPRGRRGAAGGAHSPVVASEQFRRGFFQAADRPILRPATARLAHHRRGHDGAPLPHR